MAAGCVAVVTYNVRDFRGTERFGIEVWTPVDLLRKVRLLSSTLSLRLATSLHRNLRELAEREGVSINQIINAAVGEKVAALHTLDYLRSERHRGSRAAFDAALAKVPPSNRRIMTGCLTRACSRRRRVGSRRPSE